MADPWVWLRNEPAGIELSDLDEDEEVDDEDWDEDDDWGDDDDDDDEDDDWDDDEDDWDDWDDDDDVSSRRGERLSWSQRPPERVPVLADGS